ncbi:transaldolase [Undibacterium sp. TJN19]|uniref:transaldolase n=1 Tax=Undibacterium sp. TJN19 TaxID=3413055 RepID=UPI003BF05A20
MNSHTSTLHDLGQRLWLDNINRQLLTSGTLQRYIQEYAITGLTSNPTIFEHAISAGGIYDDAIGRLAAAGLSGEELFFALALEDLTQAADLFRPVHDASNGVDGWVSLEVSPLLAHDAVNTVRAATHLHTQAKLPNLFIKIPGTAAGIEAIEEAIFNGIPVNVTLLFSAAQYLAAANAYLRGMERRQLAGLHLHVPSVASVFVSRWDVAVKEEISPQYQNRLGIAIAMQCYQAHCELLQSQRWHQLAVAGVPPQRLLWASTGTKDASAPDTMYIEALTAANTINTIPEKTLLAFADHGKAGTALPADGGYAISVLEEFRREGVDLETLAARLQTEGVVAFSDSWHALMSVILEKSRQLEKKNDVAPITPGSASKAGKHPS